MSRPYEVELLVAVAAVRQAARICQAVQSGITAETLEKKDRSPVTVADFAAQAAVCKVLADQLPDDPVVGEEDAAELRGGQAGFLDVVRGHLADAGLDADGETVCSWIDRGGHDGTGSRYWTLDPIDGTKGFLRKQQYAVSLALIEEGKIKVGVLGCPNLPAAGVEQSADGTLLSAVRGQGATQARLADPDAVPQKITVSGTSDFATARLCESVESGHSKHDQSAKIAGLLGVGAESVRLDSQAKYAVVSRGDAEIYLRLPTRADYQEKIWDHAGGVLVVEEAGGKVSDVDGKPLDFGRGPTLADNRGVVVTNAALHDRVIAAVREVLAEAAA